MTRIICDVCNEEMEERGHAVLKEVEHKGVLFCINFIVTCGGHLDICEGCIADLVEIAY